MSKYLITTTEVYRVADEAEVEALIENAKEDPTFNLNKYNCEYKEKKVKGEVEDSWYKVTLVKSFNSEKDPETFVSVSYEV
jgi:hypothetical protein